MIHFLIISKIRYSHLNNIRNNVIKLIIEFRTDDAVCSATASDERRLLTEQLARACPSQPLQKRPLWNFLTFLS